MVSVVSTSLLGHGVVRDNVAACEVMNRAFGEMERDNAALAKENRNARDRPEQQDIMKRSSSMELTNS